MSSELALYGFFFLSAIGGFLGVYYAGYKSGLNKQKVNEQEKIIDAGKRHAEIEKRQSEHVATRGQRLHIDRLHKGDF